MNRKIKSLLIILLIALPLVAGYFSYAWAYKSSAIISYDKGLKNGFIEGNSTGYSLGYDSGNSSGYVNGNLTGYETGYNFGYTKGLNDGVGSGFTVRNPTYQEMLNFLTVDQTDQNEYINPAYVCWNFACDVKNNAFNAGFRCGFVYVDLQDSVHAIVCFETIDRGLVFIEPQDDSIMSLIIGTIYTPSSTYTVLRYVIVW